MTAANKQSATLTLVLTLTNMGRRQLVAKSTSIRHIQSKPKVISSKSSTGSGWNPRSILGGIFAKNIGGQRLLALADLVQKTPIDGLEELIDEAMRSPYPEKDDFLKLAYAKWLTADPQAAFAHARELALHANTYEPLPKVLQIWAMSDPRAALTAAHSLTNTTFRNNALRDILVSWAQVDPSSAVTSARNLPKGLSDTIFPAMFDQWSRLDPQGAFSALDQITDNGVRSKARNLVIHNYAYIDPADALTTVRGLPVAQQTKQIYVDIFTQWGQQDPQTALAAIQQIPGGSLRSQAMDSMFASWSQLDPTGALKAAELLPKGADRNDALAKSFANLANADATAAAEYIASTPAGPLRNQLIGSFAGIWADSDPAATLTWLDKNAVGITYDNAIKNVLTKLSQADPVAAIAYIGYLPNNAKKTSYLQAALGEWAKNDPANAVAWANNELTGPVHDTTMLNILNPLIAADPTAALPYLQTIQSPSASLISSLGTSLANQNLSIAINWLQSLSDSFPDGARNLAISGVFDQWAQLDPAQAATYARSLAGDESSRSIITQIAGNWIKYDPSANEVPTKHGARFVHRKECKEMADTYRGVSEIKKATFSSRLYFTA